jgi:monooxygenase
MPALWRVTSELQNGSRRAHARFLYLGSGYYDYDVPHEPEIPGRDSFKGLTIHPQFWPEHFDTPARTSS